MNDSLRPRGSFDSQAVERILHRAMEIENSEQALDDVGISSQALEQAAEELGVDTQYVRAAMAEESLGLLDPTSQRLQAFVGPSRLLVSRAVQIEPPGAFAALDQWLTKSLMFRRIGEGSDGATYMRRKDFLASVRRSTSKLVGAPDLSRIMTVDVRVSADRPGRSILVLDANVRIERTINIAIGSGIAGMGSAVAVAGAAMFDQAAIQIVGVPFSFGLSAYVTYMRGRAVEMMRPELDRVLELAAAGPPPKATKSVGSAAKRLMSGRSD